MSEPNEYDSAAQKYSPLNPLHWFERLFFWRRDLTRYHWFVLIVASLGWAFDTMDQTLFVQARGPAIKSLLGLKESGPAKAESEMTEAEKEQAKEDTARVTRYKGYATSIFILGWATGGLLFGFISDRFGRAKTMLLAILVYSAFTGLSAISTSWIDFSIYRFITGLGVGGEFAAGVTLVAEVIPARARPYALGFLQALSTVGNMTAALIALVLQPSAEYGGMEGWRWLFLVGVLPALMIVFVMRRLREPEVWLAYRERVRSGQAEDRTTEKLGDIGEMFGTPQWRSHAIIGILLAATGVIGFWGLAQFLPELTRDTVLAGEDTETKDTYAALGGFLMNFGAFIGIYSFGLVAGRIGRRGAFAISFMLAFSAVVMVFGFMNTKTQILWMTPLLGFATLMPFSGFAIYFPELFPTRLRGTGTAFCYNAARYLTVAAPLLLTALSASLLSGSPDRGENKLSDLTWLSSLGSTDHAFRYAAVAFSSVYFVGLVTLLFAPETKDKPLPE